MNLLINVLAQETAPTLSDLQSLYVQIRTPLITCSAAVAALTVSTASFIFAKVKESVYDSEEYAELVRQRRFFNSGYSTHGPLDRWFRILWSTVVVASASAVANFTFGSTLKPWAIYLCYVISGLTFLMLLLVVVTTWRNARAWVKWSSLKAERRIAASPTPPPRSHASVG